MLLKMTPERIADIMIHGDQSEVMTLNKALGKLRAWTESQTSGRSTLIFRNRTLLLTPEYFICLFMHSWQRYLGIGRFFFFNIYRLIFYYRDTSCTSVKAMSYLVILIVILYHFQVLPWLWRSRVICSGLKLSWVHRIALDRIKQLSCNLHHDLLLQAQCQGHLHLPLPLITIQTVHHFMVSCRL